MNTDGELLIIPPMPVVRKASHLIIDKKFVAGVALASELWNGRIRVLARESDGIEIPFSGLFQVEDLPFTLDLIAPHELINADRLINASVILASGDDPDQLRLSKCASELHIPLAFTVENPFWGILEIIWIDRPDPFSRLKASVWAALTEFRRRKAFRLASGLQANGVPAQKSYSKTSDQLLPFFDTRMSEKTFSTDEEIAARAAYRDEGNPLRLAFSGRLERIKGVDHLLELARQIKGSSRPFTLDIYGTGSMEADVRAAAATGLVRYHGGLDFDTDLVPRLRSSCDIFISCHRQSDPSCTYLEALGCGVPILGYDNKAFGGLLSKCDAGWAVKMNSMSAIIDELERLNYTRAEITRKAIAGRDFSRVHSFEATFQRRLDNLRNLKKLARDK